MVQLTPKNDVIFKKIFGSKRNEVILKDFLSSIIEEPIKEIEVEKDMKLDKDDLNDKVGILDIKAKLDNGVQVNVEMQVVNQQNMEKRTLFYWGKLYTGSIHEGETFYGLKKTITINLLDFNYFDTKEYHTKWHIVEDTEKDKILTDVLEIHIIEIPKVREMNERESKNALIDWITFLDNLVTEFSLYENGNGLCLYQENWMNFPSEEFHILKDLARSMVKNKEDSELFFNTYMR